MINIDINKGDYILVGRFKNKRIEVKEFGVDEHGLPTINGRGILKIRIEKLMKPKNKPVNESSDKWAQGIQNTKLFDVTNEVGAWSQTGKQFLQGCKHCNSVVKLDNMHKERQMIGNVYQSLCTCSKCKRPVVFDEHKYKLYEYYLKTILKEIVKKQIKESTLYPELQKGSAIKVHKHAGIFIKGVVTDRRGDVIDYETVDKNVMGSIDLNKKDISKFIHFAGLNESKQFKLAEVAKKILKENNNNVRTFEDNLEILQKFESQDKLYSKEARELLQDADEWTDEELNDAVNDFMEQYRLSDPRMKNDKVAGKQSFPWDDDYRDGDFR